MAQTKPARPSQVTLAGWLVVIGSVVVVLMAFGQVAGLRSLETREAIEEYLAKPPGDSLGLTVSGVQTVLRVALMVAAATAAATAILGWHALQRSRGARVALSVLAVPLFVSGLAGGGIAAAVVTAAIVMLWFQPARDWFDGVSRATRSARPAAPLPHGDRDPLLDLPPPTGPPLHGTYADPSAGPHTRPYAGPDTGSSAGPGPTNRPAPVTWACVLTWLFSSAALAVLGLTAAVLIADPGVIEEARRDNQALIDAGLTVSALRDAVLATAAVVMVWSAAAVVLAVLTWRRVRWAATTLVVSAAVAGALCLLTLVGSFLLLVPLAACAATVALLLRPESRAWLRR